MEAPQPPQVDVNLDPISVPLPAPLSTPLTSQSRSTPASLPRLSQVDVNLPPVSVPLPAPLSIPLTFQSRSTPASLLRLSQVDATPAPARSTPQPPKLAPKPLPQPQKIESNRERFERELAGLAKGPWDPIRFNRLWETTRKQAITDEEARSFFTTLSSRYGTPLSSRYNNTLFLGYQLDYALVTLHDMVHIAMEIDRMPRDKQRAFYSLGYHTNAYSFAREIFSITGKTASIGGLCLHGKWFAERNELENPYLYLMRNHVNEDIDRILNAFKNPESIFQAMRHMVPDQLYTKKFFTEKFSLAKLILLKEKRTAPLDGLLRYNAFFSQKTKQKSHCEGPIDQEVIGYIRQIKRACEHEALKNYLAFFGRTASLLGIIGKYANPADDIIRILLSLIFTSSASVYDDTFHTEFLSDVIEAIQAIFESDYNTIIADPFYIDFFQQQKLTPDKVPLAIFLINTILCDKTVAYKDMFQRVLQIVVASKKINITHIDASGIHAPAYAAVSNETASVEIFNQNQLFNPLELQEVAIVMDALTLEKINNSESLFDTAHLSVQMINQIAPYAFQNNPYVRAFCTTFGSPTRDEFHCFVKKFDHKAVHENLRAMIKKWEPAARQQLIGYFTTLELLERVSVLLRLVVDYHCWVPPPPVQSPMPPATSMS